MRRSEKKGLPIFDSPEKKAAAFFSGLSKMFSAFFARYLFDSFSYRKDYSRRKHLDIPPWGIKWRCFLRIVNFWIAYGYPKCLSQRKQRRKQLEELLPSLAEEAPPFNPPSGDIEVLPPHREFLDSQRLSKMSLLSLRAQRAASSAS